MKIAKEFRASLFAQRRDGMERTCPLPGRVCTTRKLARIFSEILPFRSLKNTFRNDTPLSSIILFCPYYPRSPGDHPSEVMGGLKNATQTRKSDDGYGNRGTHPEPPDRTRSPCKRKTRLTQPRSFSNAEDSFSPHLLSIALIGLSLFLFCHILGHSGHPLRHLLLKAKPCIEGTALSKEQS